METLVRETATAAQSIRSEQASETSLTNTLSFAFALTAVFIAGITMAIVGLDRDPQLRHHHHDRRRLRGRVRHPQHDDALTLTSDRSRADHHKQEARPTPPDPRGEWA